MLVQVPRALDLFDSGMAHCNGHWQAEYARLHAALLAAPHSRQRIAVIDLSRNGLADRLTTAISVFYFSLLSGADRHLGNSVFLLTDDNPPMWTPGHVISSQRCTCCFQGELFVFTGPPTIIELPWKTY